ARAGATRGGGRLLHVPGEPLTGSGQQETKRMDYLEMDGPSPSCSDPTPAPPGKPEGAYLSDPDVQLMLRVRAGDDRAFAELQARYAPRLFAHFYRLLRDRADAEDLTQDVFLRLYRSRHSYQPRARFGTWIFHVTQNVARNALRSRRRASAVRP